MALMKERLPCLSVLPAGPQKTRKAVSSLPGRKEDCLQTA